MKNILPYFKQTYYILRHFILRSLIANFFNVRYLSDERTFQVNNQNLVNF